MKNIFKNIVPFLALVILIGCSSDKQESQVEEPTENIEVKPERKELLTVKDTIEANLSEAMERLYYHDNSGLYENEFAYLKDEHNFDSYITFGQISYRNPKQVSRLVVDSIELYQHDSALTWVTIDLEDNTGKVETISEQALITYFHDGRWIKPTVSVIQNQIPYDEIIQQAIRDAEGGN